ncbi:MAG: ATP synthase F1 subunit gamma [Peptococcaceae bacterium]|nr:ATP synthase F1 subunit gamma [Peptococcaceae bacterium]
MASMREIKRRKASIASTQQITKAMKLVSTVKLQRAKGKAEATKPYFDCMYDTVATMLSKSGNVDHPYLKSGASSKKAVITITSNRGLAGGYNNNIVKLITGDETFDTENTEIYALGKKGRDSLALKGYTIASDLSEVMNGPIYADAKELSEALLERFEKGEIGEIYLAYTVFKNTVTHVPTMLKLLPVEIEAKDATETDNIPMNYEPDEEEALGMIIPKYITSLIYGAMMEAVASENGARMQAMDSATSNAEEMIQKLELDYNRARQGSITQELTEIIAGAQAIS